MSKSPRPRAYDVTRTPRAGGRQPLSDDALELIATRLRVIAEPTRIRLMEILNDGSTSVQALTARLGTTTQNVSRHLAILYQVGIVSRRREGTWVHYELIDWTGLWLVEQIAACITSAPDNSQTS